jgi:oxidase EvaA
MSAVGPDGITADRDEVLAWRADRVRASQLVCDEIPFSTSGEWAFDDGVLHHHTGRYFSVVGIQAQSSVPTIDGLRQPIIAQPEIGILGFLIQKRGDRTNILVQAKVEPGNVGIVQLAPTVQATVSNYQRLHGGSATPFLEWFDSDSDAETVYDQVQSEQGSRYLDKFNRNAVVELPSDTKVPHSPNHRWLDTETLFELITENNLFNTDARSVLACVDWRRLNGGRPPFQRWRGKGGFGEALLNSHESADDLAEHGLDRLSNWLAEQRRACRLTTERVPLEQLAGWSMDESRIIDTDRSLFAVRQFRVRTRNREVSAWDQPLISSLGKGRVALLCQRRNGVLHFLLQGLAEVGFRESVQVTATVQVPPQKESSAGSRSEAALEALIDELEPRHTHIHSVQSEEGGRFFRDENDYLVVEAPEERDIDTTDRFRWMTLGQIKALLAAPGIFTNEARSIFSLLMRYI